MSRSAVPSCYLSALTSQPLPDITPAHVYQVQEYGAHSQTEHKVDYAQSDLSTFVLLMHFSD